MTINKVTYFHSIRLTKKNPENPEKPDIFGPDLKSGSGIPEIQNLVFQKIIVSVISYLGVLWHKTGGKIKFLFFWYVA